ncbi:MAG: DNA-formamidopyrimidine glycosylase family protein [Methanomicrobiales archaeon]
MPELPDVEVFRRYLNKNSLNKTIKMLMRTRKYLKTSQNRLW